MDEYTIIISNDVGIPTIHKNKKVERILSVLQGKEIRGGQGRPVIMVNKPNNEFTFRILDTVINNSLIGSKTNITMLNTDEKLLIEDFTINIQNGDTIIICSKYEKFNNITR